VIRRDVAVGIEDGIGRDRTRVDQPSFILTGQIVSFVIFIVTRW
jgi:hypothetical protein